MIKELEKLKEIDRCVISGEYTIYKDDIEEIKLALEVLEIIVKKRVDITLIMCCSLKEYNILIKDTFFKKCGKKFY